MAWKAWSIGNSSLDKLFKHNMTEIALNIKFENNKCLPYIQGKQRKFPLRVMNDLIKNIGINS